MSSEHRFVGVAQLAEGLDPDAPRVVVDLTRGRPAAADGETVSRPAEARAAQPPAVAAAATRPVLAVAAQRPTVAVAATRPRGYGSFAEHRKRWRRAVLRRLEVIVWFMAGAVVVTMAIFVARTGVPRAEVARFLPTPAPSASATAQPGSACIFESCAQPAPSGEPTRVRIASIEVESVLEVLALDAQGTLEPPKQPDQAGWYAKGVVPGDPGAAVIAGHVDFAKRPAVFYDLERLRPGDVVEVQRGGEWIAFRVTTTEQYPKEKFPTAQVYQPTPGAELRLITCGGTFDDSRQSYRDNIVVYAILA